MDRSHGQWQAQVSPEHYGHVVSSEKNSFDLQVCYVSLLLYIDSSTYSGEAASKFPSLRFVLKKQKNNHPIINTYIETEVSCFSDGKPRESTQYDKYSLRCPVCFKCWCLCTQLNPLHPLTLVGSQKAYLPLLPCTISTSIAKYLGTYIGPLSISLATSIFISTKI